MFLADRTAFPQTLELLAARAEPLGLELRIVDVDERPRSAPDVFGVLLQSPDVNGLVRDLSAVDRPRRTTPRRSPSSPAICWPAR